MTYIQGRFSRKTRVWFASHPRLWQAGVRSLSKHALVLYYSFTMKPAEKNHTAHGCLLLYPKTSGCISSFCLLLYTHKLFHIIQYKLFGLCWLRYDMLLCYSGERCAGRSSILPRAIWCLFYGKPSVRGFMSIFSIQNSSRKALLLRVFFSYLHLDVPVYLQGNKWYPCTVWHYIFYQPINKLSVLSGLQYILLFSNINGAIHPKMEIMYTHNHSQTVWRTSFRNTEHNRTQQIFWRTFCPYTLNPIDFHWTLIKLKTINWTNKAFIVT